MSPTTTKTNQTAAQPRQHRGWTKLLAVIASIAIIVCTYGTVLRDNFSTAAKLVVFMKNASTFVHISDAVKSEVSANLPQSVKDNFLQNALAQKLLDVIVTPENVAKVAEPILTTTYKVADKADAQIKNNNVVIESAKYKDQASKFVNDSKLPQVLADPLNSLINSVPSDITIVNGQKNPDSPLLLMVKLRMVFQKLSALVTVLWWVIILSLLGIVALNWRDYRSILRSTGLTIGVSGLIITIGSWVFAPIALIFLPQSTDPVIGSSLNQATSDIINYYFTLTRPYGFFLLTVGLTLYLLYRFDVIARGTAFVGQQLKKRSSKSTHHSTHHTAKK